MVSALTPGSQCQNCLVWKTHTFGVRSVESRRNKSSPWKMKTPMPNSSAKGSTETIYVKSINYKALYTFNPLICSSFLFFPFFKRIITINIITGLHLLWLMRNVNFFLKWSTNHRRKKVQHFSRKQGRRKQKFPVKETVPVGCWSSAPMWLSNSLRLHPIMPLWQWHCRSPNFTASATTNQSHTALLSRLQGPGLLWITCQGN